MMAKKQSAKDRTDFLNLVLDKKDILFGSLSATLTSQKKQQCWQSIRANLMAAGGSALTEKHMEESAGRNLARLQAADGGEARQAGRQRR
jgi:hypothetical protein